MPLFLAGLFRDRAQAEQVIHSLLAEGVASEDISLACRDRAEEDVSEREALGEGSAFPELAIHSAWERLGWQGGARPAYRDRFSPKIEMAFIAAGPLAVAIGGAQLGAASGGIVGSMTNFGFTHELSRQWYDELVRGRAWVMVRTTGPGAGPTRRVFERYQADMQAESHRHW